MSQPTTLATGQVTATPTSSRSSCTSRRTCRPSCSSPGRAATVASPDQFPAVVAGTCTKVAAARIGLAQIKAQRR